jgi:hypothetical protein
VKAWKGGQGYISSIGSADFALRLMEEGITWYCGAEEFITPEFRTMSSTL